MPKCALIASTNALRSSPVTLKDTINAINAMDITSNTYLKLMVSGKADQSAVDALGERMDAAELKITEDAIVSTVTGSQQYKDDLASVSVSGSGVEMIVGTQTANTSAWTGVAAFSELKDGLQIAYWLPYSSTGTATLELTMPDGTTTGAIPLYFSQSSRLGTQYPAGNVIRLTYRENAKYFSNTIAQGRWADANYNTDTYDRIKSGSVKAKENISYFRFAVGDDEGYFQLDAGKAFNVYQRLESGDLDAVVGFREAPDTKINAFFKELSKSSIVCVCARNHALAGVKEICMEDLKKEKLVLFMPPKGMVPIMRLQGELMGNRPPSEFYFCESTESIIVLVVAGYGISVLPDFLVPDDPTLAKIPLKDTEPMPFGIYYQSLQGKPGLKAFIQCAKEDFA